MSRDGLPKNRIEAALERVETRATESDCPGTSVAITDESEIIGQSGFGSRNVDRDELATEATLYAVGSVTKPITALAVLLLDERGQIDVRDPVPDYVPYFEDAPGEPITVRQLLSHTSGMPRDDLAFRSSDLADWDAFRDFLAETVDRRRVDHQGCIYYNSGYVVLARLVEVVTGTDFPSFAEREIFDPLGMRRSTFDSSVIEREWVDVMTPYVAEEGTIEEAAVADNPVIENRLLNGAGGLFTSVADLAQFLQANIGEGDSQMKSALERMRTSVGISKRLVDGTEFAYGYGWEIKPFGSDAVVGHGGNTGVSRGFVGFLEERGIGIAIGCNGPAEPESIAREALAVLTGSDTESVDPVQSIERNVRRLAGRYESYTGTHWATVGQNGTGVEIEIGGGVDSFAIRAIPADLDDERYRFTDVDSVETTTDVEFFVDDGAVELLFEGLLFRRVDAGGVKGDRAGG